MLARLTRMSAVLIVAAPFAAAPLRAQGVEYAAGTTKYKLTTTTKGTQTSPMGSQDFQVDILQRLTVSLARQAKDTLVETVTMDTVAVSSPMGAQDVRNLIGSKFVSYISPTGRVYSSAPLAGADPMLSQVSDMVGRFLPTYHRDLKAGMAWADTSSGKVTQQGMQVDRTIISNYRVAGDTSVAGERAFKVERVSTVKASGSGTAQGTNVALESSTASNALLLLSGKGVYLGGHQDDDVDLKLTLLAQNAAVSIKQQVKTTVEPIR